MTNDQSYSLRLSRKEQFHSTVTKTKRHSSLSIFSSIKSESSDSSNSPIIHFGCQQHSGNEYWDTSYFLALIFELFDELKTNSHDESRLAAFIICRLNDIHLNHSLPIKLVIQILTYFTNIRLKILVFLELLIVCETIDCSQALTLLWPFSTYGYMTLFYVLDRMKFSIVDKDAEWKMLLTIFEPLENKKHAAYIVLDKTNFYKPNRAIIVFGSKKLHRFF